MPTPQRLYEDEIRSAEGPDAGRGGSTGATTTKCFAGTDVGAVLGSPDPPDYQRPCVPGEKAATGRTGGQKRIVAAWLGPSARRGGLTVSNLCLWYLAHDGLPVMGWSQVAAKDHHGSKLRA